MGFLGYFVYWTIFTENVTKFSFLSSFIDIGSDLFIDLQSILTDSILFQEIFMKHVTKF